MEKNSSEIISWEAPEYEYYEKTNDWFWALAIVVISASAVAIIYDNYLFAVFLVLGGFSLAFFGMRKPDIITYSVNPKGIAVKNFLHPYEEMSTFWINKEEKKILIITKKPFIPLIIIPVHEGSMEEVQEELKNHVEEEYIEEPFYIKIMDRLGF